jgi:tRNA pseudouridine55 synthase
VARRDTARFHGFLIVDKPAGWTSHDVVARIRRLTRQRSIGHAGTLDPAATGVLPVALGDATKVLNAVDDASKTYLAEITFGIETDTYDADGRLTAQNDVSRLTLGDISALLTAFQGSIRQQAPRYSAIQRQGRRLYDLARQGVEFEPPWRNVVIRDLQIVSFITPVLTICVDCGAGTYIRSLAHDLGRTTGTGAHLSNLVRLRSGPFTLAHAWTISDLERLPLDQQWPSIAFHPDSAIARAPAIILDQDQCADWAVGRSIHIGLPVNDQFVRAYSESGDWLGYGVPAATEDGPVIRPRRVISPVQ